MAFKFFITHSWKDIAFARRLAGDLEAMGLEGFLDDSSIRPGENIAASINNGLAECDVFVPILSRAALASPWTLKEIYAAIFLSNEPSRKNRPLILPVVVEKTEIPSILRARIYIDFTGRYEDGLAKLAKGLGVSTKGGVKTSPAAPGQNIQEQLARQKTEAELLLKQKRESERIAREELERKRAAHKKARIFLTHSSRDNPFAKRLYNDLRAYGIKGFFDIESLMLGDDIAEQINRGLEECDIYMPILSQAALNSRWCKHEINAAINLSNEADGDGRPRIISVLAENCRKQMPPLLKVLLYIEFIGDYQSAFRDLLERGFSLEP